MVRAVMAVKEAAVTNRTFFILKRKIAKRVMWYTTTKKRNERERKWEA